MGSAGRAACMHAGGQRAMTLVLRTNQTGLLLGRRSKCDLHGRMPPRALPFVRTRVHARLLAPSVGYTPLESIKTRSLLVQPLIS